MVTNKLYDTKSLMSLLNIFKTWKFWKEFLLMNVAMFVAATAIYYFLLPSNLVVGSVTGLSIVLSGVFAKFGMVVKVSFLITIINAILLVLAWFLIDHEFGAKTVYTAMVLGPFTEIVSRIMPYEALIAPGETTVMGSLWMDLLCFILILSVSQAILFNINASTGGLDILAKIVNKYLHFDIGASVTIAGACICCSAFAINPFRLVVTGLIGTWLNGIVIDYYTATLNRKKRVCLITDDYERIRKYIIETLKRGCSLYELKGGYTLEKHMEIEAILATDEFASLMSYIKDNNIDAFITAGNVSEIYGKWKPTGRFAK